MPRIRKFGPHMTVGATKLRQYLDERGVSVPRFCEDHGLERLQVQRMLNGQRPRVSLRFAADIALATGGEVPMLAWNEPVSASATG